MVQKMVIELETVLCQESRVGVLTFQVHHGFDFEHESYYIRFPSRRDAVCYSAGNQAILAIREVCV